MWAEQHEHADPQYGTNYKLSEGVGICSQICEQIASKSRDAWNLLAFVAAIASKSVA
jgi:hypothetical protein